MYSRRYICVVSGLYLVCMFLMCFTLDLCLAKIGPEVIYCSFNCFEYAIFQNYRLEISCCFLAENIVMLTMQVS